MNATLPIIGSAFFIFRIWLVQFKLAEELQFRKDYVSRMMSLYYCIAMILQFKNPVFNIIVAASTPVLIASFFGWDLLFFIKFKNRDYWEKNHTWLLVERLTLHPPIMLTGIYWYITGLSSHIIITNWWATISASAILVLGPFVLWDKRISEKYIYPTGLHIFLSALASLIFTVLYLIWTKP